RPPRQVRWAERPNAPAARSARTAPDLWRAGHRPPGRPAAEAKRMHPAGIRIGNQTNCHAPARLPYEFALRHGFDAFEWFSDQGRAGWCEDDTPPAERAELRRAAQAGGMRFSVHAPHAADPTTRAGAEAVRKSIRFGGDVG